MEIITAKTSGFCFGVKRAVNLCEEVAEKCSGRCFTLGPIIHNKSVTDDLWKKGVHSVDSLEGIGSGDTVIIRSHGVGRAELAEIEATGAAVIDATCPDVAKIHRIVQEESEAGRKVVIIGERSHPEVLAISGWCNECQIFETPQELEEWLAKMHECRSLPLSFVFQTTGTRENFELCVKIIKKLCTNYKLFDTICRATFRRQNEAEEIAKIADAMVVIGGQHSANSKRLAEICSRQCADVLFIETADELDVSRLKGARTVGVTAGASTPAWIIKEVNQKMSEEIRVDGIPEASEGESFEEMLEKSIKTLYTGEKVTGVIAAITPTEISVDLGTKQSGYIPISELTDDPTVKVEDLVKVGDEIETYVMRVNDMEGTVMLSKKRLDSVKNWDDIEKAKEEKTVVEGTVIEENKGGIVASAKGIRVFIPASQTGLGKDVPMSTLVKTKVRFCITEVNQSRRRVVGSIRTVLNEERRAKAEQVWNEIEVGKKYTGIVKSMTSYGAFVDIGGIDGMVHVSELSWTRIRQPSDVLSIGDEIEVYVISFDKEKKKISLGYKTEDTNPWKKFMDSYKVGDVVTAKVVKLMPFGAFAEIIPGVDGLIHISQIADHRIGMPSEVLSEGQEVNVKITDVDEEKHKVSVSIRALLEGEPVQEQESDAQDDAPVVVYDTDTPPAPEDIPDGE